MLETPVALGLAAPFTFTLSQNPLLIFSDSGLANDDEEGVHFKLLAKLQQENKGADFSRRRRGRKTGARRNRKSAPA